MPAHAPVFIVLVAVSLQACGSGSTSKAQPKSTSTTAFNAARNTFGACKPVPKPDSAATPPPATIPLPPATFVSSATSPIINGTSTRQLVLVSPVTIDGLARFVASTWPSAGIVRGRSEREMNDMEVSFSSNRLSGSLQAASSFCEQGTVEIVLAYYDREQPLLPG
jgi:hypothetical protein